MGKQDYQKMIELLDKYYIHLELYQDTMKYDTKPFWDIQEKLVLIRDCMYTL